MKISRLNAFIVERSAFQRVYVCKYQTPCVKRGRYDRRQWCRNIITHVCTTFSLRDLQPWQGPRMCVPSIAFHVGEKPPLSFERGIKSPVDISKMTTSFLFLRWKLRSRDRDRVLAISISWLVNFCEDRYRSVINRYWRNTRFATGALLSPAASLRPNE